MKEILTKEIDQQFSSKNIFLEEVFEYSPPNYIPEWSGDYNRIDFKGGGSAQRPNKEKTSLKLSLKIKNPLNITKQSTGIYLFYKKASFFYVGKTSARIEQRFHAHVTKITSTNNDRHDHPKKWQEFAQERYRKMHEKSVQLSDLKMCYFDISNFREFLNSSNKKDFIDEFEALIFYYFRKKFSDLIFLNTENQIRTEKFRQIYKKFWNL